MMPSLQQWQSWSSSRARATGAARAVRRRFRPPAPPAPPTLWRPTGDVTALVVIDKLSPSTTAAIAAPLERLGSTHTAVLLPSGTTFPVGEQAVGWSPIPLQDMDALPPTITQVLTLGSYLELAGQARTWAGRHDVRHSVVQHGMLTPWSPPAAAGDHVLAWSRQDAEYWAAGRSDITTEVVGAQLLWSAAHTDGARPAHQASAAPVMLGQLHGIELDRREAFGIYREFCRTEQARYRPHPNEQDLLSRLQHRRLQRAGVQFETSGAPLTQLDAPVVSIFSTGTLEAAHRGLPAFVTHPDPPEWIRDVWRRYRLAPWGGQSTAAWAGDGPEPAAAVAEAVRG